MVDFKGVMPSRCTAKLSTEFGPDHVAEPKIDGSRFVLYLGTDPYDRGSKNAFLSRRISSVDDMHVDRSGNVPHITGLDYGDLKGTVLDGEIFKTDFPTTSSIMGSDPAKAIERQVELGNVTYYVFDCPTFKGIDIRQKTLAERRKVLIHVVKTMNNPNVRLVPQFTENFNERFNQIVAAGGEGLIIKDLTKAYGVGWAKWKKSYDVSCIISGFKKGKGKYEDSIGAVAVSVYKGSELVEVGFASGFDDKLRNEMAANPKAFIGLVVDVFAQEFTGSRLRHPTWHRFREDVEPNTVTLAKLESDCTKVRGNRNKDE